MDSVFIIIRYGFIGYLPFNLQNDLQGMSPNGEMWFQDGRYQADFSLTTLYLKHLFLHEMMHIWQHQRGMWVRTRGAFSWAADYSYSLDKATLLDYGLEQQASIVSDYWVLINYGFYRTSAPIQYRDYNPAISEKTLIAQYKKVLGSFPV